jgi:hypothetical protein
MRERHQTRIAAIQALSSVIVAASVLTLVRHHKRAAVPTISPSTSSQLIPWTKSAIEDRPSSPEPQQPLKARVVRRTIDFLILIPLLLATFWFGSMESPKKIAILVGGLFLYFAWACSDPTGTAG